jgi:acyl-CoA thioester hydrolase
MSGPAALPTPFVSSVMTVEPQWIDYNAHLNVAYYNVLFDRAVDEFYELVGLGLDYLKRHNYSTMVAESHVRYLRELHEGAPVRISVQLLDYDGKRIHLYEELRHAAEHWLAATCETMTLSVDMTARKVGPFPARVLAALEKTKAAHAALPWPEAAGRSVGMPRKA